MPSRPEKPRLEPEKPGPDKGDGDKGERKVRRCPICGRPAAEATRPFCSARCRDVDLNRWLSGTYVVPGSENDEEDEK
ncbi:MAG TPA: DNA gyrase inhibitor YacG [Bradyrhizobium sp.]|uniref:DNA gyrase inhibitor YacG n=1 Tax=Bradyrhizobium sp. TaxID=376 RepID=UPI002C535278|nr:DNA gyrase inhibitor YacG [Bradyrhizobium sp.]HLZ06365.1 DNA gyrase inhibitor YacG [Bradyrhizobium sp.]